jgi:hypothetical protein
MTRYKFSTTIELDGKKVAIRFCKSEVIADIATVARERLEAAIKILARAEMKLNKKPWPESVGNAAEKYFLPDGGSLYDEDKLKIILAVSNTKRGLLNDLEKNKLLIKTSDIIKGGPHVSGQVTVINPDILKEKGLKYYHCRTQEIYSESYIITGPIHIKETFLRHDIFGALVLIHEATHRYAGTVDHAYYAIESLGNIIDTKISNSKSLSNADSYAWFIMKIGDYCWPEPSSEL